MSEIQQGVQSEEIKKYAALLEETREAALPPIPGKWIDPEPKVMTATIQAVDKRSQVAGFGYRAFLRFSRSRATLLAAGTTYYVFLAVFSLAVVGYGVALTFGAEKLTELITDALNEAFPQLVGSAGIDPTALQNAGETMGIIGGVVLLFSGSGAMYAMARSLHVINGAPKSSRNYVWERIRLLLWMLLLAPMMLLSFVLAGAFVGFGNAISDNDLMVALIWVVAVLLNLALDFSIDYLMLSFFGGIRPSRSSLAAGAAFGALAATVLKYVAAVIVTFSISKPQYGALAAPIAVLLILYLQTAAFYLAAAITAGLAGEAGASALRRGQNSQPQAESDDAEAVDGADPESHEQAPAGESPDRGGNSPPSGPERPSS